MKDKYIKDTKPHSTILNMRHPDTGHYAEVASHEDGDGRYWVMPGCSKVYDWPTVRAKALKIFGRAGYKLTC